jgi:hypothetical protein
MPQATEGVAHGPAQRLGTANDEQASDIRLQPALDQIGLQRLDHGGLIAPRLGTSGCDNTAVISRYGLFPGKPTGSAMQLAWAHAEFIKLIISRHLGHPSDRPTAVWRRYGGRRPEAKRAIWCLHAPIGSIKHAIALIIALPRAAHIHWGINCWQHIADGETQKTGLGLHSLELDAAVLLEAHQIDFTFQWRDTQLWMGKDFHIAVGN